MDVGTNLLPKISLYMEADDSHTPEGYKRVYYIMDTLGRAELMQACPGDKVEKDK